MEYQVVMAKFPEKNDEEESYSRPGKAEFLGAGQQHLSIPETSLGAIDPFFGEDTTLYI